MFASVLGWREVGLWENFWLTLALRVQDSVLKSSAMLLVEKTAWEPELVFYCCGTYHHKFSNWKQDAFTLSQFLWVRSPGSAELRPLFRISGGCNQEADWAVGLSRAWVPLQRSRDHWQTLVPCIWRAEFPISQRPRGILYHVAVCYFKANREHLCCFLFLKFFYWRIVALQCYVSFRGTAK